jgi:hypothetical protein
VRVLKLNAADVVGYNGAVDACAKALMTASAVIQILPEGPEGPEGWQILF